MSDIRINALTTTATSSASDDYLPIDGSANGTRKLSAYSPTFGGNLTVSGTATLGPTNPFKFDTNVMQSTASGFNGALVRSAVSTVGNPTFSNVDDTDTGIYFPAPNTLAITTGGTQRLSVDATATTLAGNLTVSGTSGATATDLTLGTSGPSVKSSLSARAPRQGLVYDGTTNSSATLNSAIGTSDFTVSVPFTVPASNPSGARGIFSIGNFGNAQVFCVYIGTGGALDIVLFGATAGDYRASGVNGFVSANAGKTGLLTITRSSTTLTVYFNGVSQTLVAPTIGGVDPTWAGTLTSTSVRHGNMSTTSFFYVGYVGDLDLYNRALSASEVVALYEAGAPSANDNTGLVGYPAGVATNNTAAWSSDGTATITVNTPTAVTFSDTDFGYLYSINSTPGLAMKNGRQAYVTFTASGVTGTITATVRAQPGDVLRGGPITVANGANVIPITAAGGGGTNGLSISMNWNGVVGATITNVQWVPVGLLLAPDAAQAGGGLTWYDTSGNAANITLPASGVSWNVPSSRVLGGNWTTSGTLTISGGQAVNIGSSANYNLWKDATPTKAGRVILNNTVTNGLSLGLYDGSSWVDTLHIHPTNNNVLIGTNIDGGQKLQVSGSGIFGNTTAASTTSPINVSLGATYGTTIANGIKLSIFDSGVVKHGVGVVSGVLYLATTDGATTIQLATNSTTALTLDSSQNATFAGNVVLGAGKRVAYSASAYMTPENNVDGAEIASPGQFTVKTASTQALKIDSSQNATFAGDITISSAYPKINLTDTNNNSDFSVLNDNGRLAIYDETNAAYRFTVGATGGIKVGSTPEDVGANNFKVQGDTIIATKTPASASATGTAGTIAWDASYIYVCTATNTWKRVAIATWP